MVVVVRRVDDKRMAERLQAYCGVDYEAFGTT
jgi:hypothetical protein